MNHGIPCVLMRGGTSRGPFFLSDWLPADVGERDRVLLGAMGSPHELQIDGLGGGSSLTSKVAIVSRSTRPGCDVDYLFAQVSVESSIVDTRPNCGNMLAGVGPFAIEQGLVAATPGTTVVRVFNVNTGARIDARVLTPDGRVQYDGSTRIDGVEGTAAPVLLDFKDGWGGVTGKLFPTGLPLEEIDGLPVTCIDAAQVMVLLRAADLGLSGTEMPQALDAMPELLARLESVRRQAGQRMGLGDVTTSVLPKPVIVSSGGPAAVVSRYFTPWRCHRSHAATGAVGVAAATMLPGTVASLPDLAGQIGRQAIRVLHPAGAIEVEAELAADAAGPRIARAGLVRTARKILEGQLYVPHHAWPQAA